MRLGVLLIPTDPWPQAVERARHLEALGYDHLWVYDHLSWRRYHDEPWHATYPWLAGLAGATEHIGLGTMVSNPSIRHPVTLAKDAMTIDHISNGRLTIGLGAGGTGFDATVLGQTPLTPGQRIGRLAEFAACFDGLLTGELTHHRGDWFTIDDARILPGCVQQPRLPLAIAAGGPKALDIAARHADAWITYGDTSYEALSVEDTERIVAEQMAHLEARAEAHGRDPSSIDRIYVVGISEARPLSSIDAFVDFVGRYRELGFTDLVFHDPRPDDPVWNDDPEIVERIAATLLSPQN